MKNKGTTCIGIERVLLKDPNTQYVFVPQTNMKFILRHETFMSNSRAFSDPNSEQSLHCTHDFDRYRKKKSNFFAYFISIVDLEFKFISKNLFY